MSMMIFCFTLKMGVCAESKLPNTTPSQKVVTQQIVKLKK